MTAVLLLALGLFDTVVCIVEIPKMIRQKLFRELGTFLVLLLFGTTIGIMKCFDLEVPNPTDLLAWIFSPVKDLMKTLMTP
jgi:hypothetical protein